MDVATVLLIEPERLMREGLKVLLRGSPFSVMHEAENLKAAEDMLRSAAKIDLILAQVSSKNDEAISGLAHLRTIAPDAKLVILTAVVDRELLNKAMDLKINGMLLKDISAEALIRSLHLALLGEGVFAVHGFLLRDLDSPRSLPSELTLPSSTLSLREASIVRCLTAGQSNKSIARELGLTEATVKAHVKVIMRKIKAQNRTQAAIWGLANGLDRREPARNGAAPRVAAAAAH